MSCTAGRPGSSTQHAVIGLKSFARAMDRITDRAHADRIEDALLDAQERIQQIKQQIDKAFARNHLRPKEKGVSKKPTVLEVTLHTRQAHRAAQLLSEFDEQITRCLSLYKLGVHGRHEHNAMVRSLTHTVSQSLFITGVHPGSCRQRERDCISRNLRRPVIFAS